MEAGPKGGEMEPTPKYKKGVMGFDQMAMGVAVLAIVVAMVLVVLITMSNTATIVFTYADPTNLSSAKTATTANTTFTQAISGLSLYGSFFSIVVILGI